MFDMRSIVQKSKAVLKVYVEALLYVYEHWNMPRR